MSNDVSAKKKSSRPLVICIYLLLYVAAQVVIFLFNESYEANYWCSFGFLTFTLLFGIVEIFVSKGNKGIDDYYYNVPLYITFMIYYLIEIAASLIFVFLLDSLEFRMTFVIHFLLFIVFLAVTLILLSGKENAKTTISNTKDNEKFIRNMVVDIEYIMNSCGNNDVKEMIEKLLEEARYSTPADSKYLNNIEVEIKNNIMNLSQSVTLQNYRSAENIVEDLTKLIDKRNCLCRE